MKAINISHIERFVSTLDEDAGTEHETIFLLRVLDSRVMSYLIDVAQSANTKSDNKVEKSEDNLDVGFVIKRDVQFAFDAASFALTGVENLKDSEGNDVEFTTVKKRLGQRDYDVASPEFLRQLDIQVLNEISMHSMMRNRIKANDAKN